MRFQVRFDKEQTNTLVELMQMQADRASHMAPALHEITRVYRAEQERAFADGGGRYGKWPVASALTQASKDRRGKPQLMVDKDTLKGSLTGEKPEAKWSSTMSTNTLAILGTRDPIAHNLAYGTKERVQKTTGRRTGAMPARPVGFVTRAMVGQFYAILEEYLVSGEVTAGQGPIPLEGLGI